MIKCQGIICDGKVEQPSNLIRICTVCSRPICVLCRNFSPSHVCQTTRDTVAEIERIRAQVKEEVSMQKYRVFFRSDGLFNGLHSIDVETDRAPVGDAFGEVVHLAMAKLIHDLVEQDSDADWEVVAVTKIEICEVCGRPYELNLKHGCPVG